MRKKIIYTALVLILFIVLLSGCFEEEQLTDKEKFIGKWKAEEKGYKNRAFEFFNNGSCYIRTYKLKGSYHVNESEKTLVVNQTSPKMVYVYSYKFNYNNDKLTLINQNTFDQIAFKKVE